ncbi:putative conserved protein, DUF1015 family [Abditibacterium utsteinense]|uniref:Putative conserved protein, DUF1015 family n=1 Tax=Abditibacterium utsteinense TaxID=1960156 RepID=A0A2S8STP3_9BACT|nr:DUF1015 domain-containing protein [Abditibacterium utsteinense]PQV64174.1 putative conserved protein, DUF1015 family [Abditibacterium utsteinense]
MAQFLPFRGLRYDTSKTELSNAICPPYDVIKGAARDELIARDAHNVVAIELAARYGEQATPEQYQACGQLLQQWKADGTLKRDDSAYYIYEQEFALPSGEIRKRRGIMGALTLEEFGKGVQPHEHTMSGPKADRLNLLRALRTNTSPIFGLVADGDGWINGLINDVVLSAPSCQASDAEGITHRLWVMCEDEIVNGFEAAFENESILIADGHHRYETALNYFKETGAENGGESAVMMLCVSMQDEGLVVLPTHRVAKNVSDAEVAALPAKLAEFFEVEPFSGDANALLQQLNSIDSKQNALGMHLRGQSYLLKRKANSALPDASKSAAYNALDVAVLGGLILEKGLGIDAAKVAAGGHIAYTIDALEAVRQVEVGEGAAAFLLRETPVTQVQEVADAGDKMPQKSTYFYPKLATGMVLRPLD